MTSILAKVPPELRPAAVLHQRLALSSADFKHARGVAERILKGKLHKKYFGANADLLRALNCSMVMAYTRPFCGAQARRRSAVPALPGKVLRVLSPTELQVHHTAMRDRNKYMAHTDADAVQLETVLVDFPNGSETLIYIGNDRLAPLDAKATRRLGSAARKLWMATQAAATAIEVQLRPYFRRFKPETLHEALNAA